MRKGQFRKKFYNEISSLNYLFPTNDADFLDSSIPLNNAFVDYFLCSNISACFQFIS